MPISLNDLYWLVSVAVLACTRYVPARAEEASTTQPGSVIERSQVAESWAGTPLRSSSAGDRAGLEQSAESHTMRSEDSTTTWSWRSLKAQLAAAVDTA